MPTLKESPGKELLVKFEKLLITLKEKANLLHLTIIVTPFKNAAGNKTDTKI